MASTINVTPAAFFDRNSREVINFFPDATGVVFTQNFTFVLFEDYKTTGKAFNTMIGCINTAFFLKQDIEVVSFKKQNVKPNGQIEAVKMVLADSAESRSTSLNALNF